MKHTCHAIGCDCEVPPKMLMCAKHWRQVPKPLQQQVWATYRPGQEVEKNPTPEYLAAARAAIASIEPVNGGAAFHLNQAVTNDRGWHGRIVKVDGDRPNTPDGFYYFVHWREREQHSEKAVKKTPVLGHTVDQIKPIGEVQHETIDS